MAGARESSDDRRHGMAALFARRGAPERARRRLRRVAAALAPAAEAEVEEAAALRARMEELQLEQNALQLRLGAITAETMSVDNVFSPPEGDFSLEEVAAFFRTNGFWCIPNAVSGAWLQRVQQFLRATAVAAVWVHLV